MFVNFKNARSIASTRSSFSITASPSSTKLEAYHTSPVYVTAPEEVKLTVYSSGMTYPRSVSYRSVPFSANVSTYSVTDSDSVVTVSRVNTNLTVTL